MTTKKEPYDIELEQAALGALLVNNDRIDEAASMMRADVFYDPLHQRIYSDNLACNSARLKHFLHADLSNRLLHPHPHFVLYTILAPHYGDLGNAR